MKRGSGKSLRTPHWSISVAANAVVDAARNVNPAECDTALAEAVLADHYRDAGVPPLAPSAFATVTAKMDDTDWLRFAVIVGMFAVDKVRAPLAEVSARMTVSEQIEKGMAATAKALKAIEPRVLATSMVRAEELARRVAKGLAISFKGETAAASAERLAKIDYTRLLAKVDAAKASAEEQMAELFKHQEDEDNRIKRRGKW